MRASGGACGLCGSRRATDAWRTEFRTVRRCLSCKLMWCEPMPDEAELARLYGADAFGKRDVRQDGETPAGYLDYRETRFLARPDSRRIAMRLRELLDGASCDAPPTLLDVGCASGDFMEVAHDCGFAVKGVERDPVAVAELTARYRFPLSRLEFAEFDGGPYDAVTMLDVIERLLDPFAALEQAASLVRPGGILGLSTLDLGTATARLLGSRNELVRYASAGEHLWFFPRETLTTALDQAGFHVVRIDGHGSATGLGAAAQRVAVARPGLSATARRALGLLGLSRALEHFDHRVNMVTFSVRRSA